MYNVLNLYILHFLKVPVMEKINEDLEVLTLKHVYHMWTEKGSISILGNEHLFSFFFQI